MPQSPRGGDPVSEAQFTQVRDAAAALGVYLDLAVPDGPGAGPAFVFQKDHVLVSPGTRNDHPLLRDLHPEDGVATPRAVRPEGVAPSPDDPPRMRLLKITPPADATVLDVVRQLYDAFDGQISPNHLVSISPVNLCPATEPLLPVTWGTTPLPHWNAAPTAGRGVRVHVIDTGLIKHDPADYPWVGDVDGPFRDPYEPDFGTASTNDRVHLYGGHGMFVAGVLKWFAPKAELYEWKLPQMAGAIMEDALTEALMESLAQAPAMISLSAGGATLEGRPLLALEPVYQVLRQPTCKTLLVAAAGNDGGRGPFYPAAMHADPSLRDAVVSVGATRSTGDGRACFSNYGSWVRVFAPGEDHLNAFPPGEYEYHEPESTVCRYYHPPLHYPCTCVNGPAEHSTQTLGRLARWSGTSFATPLVAGRIAAYMTEHSESNARVAAQQFLGLRTVPINDPVDHVVIRSLPLS